MSASDISIRSWRNCFCSHKYGKTFLKNYFLTSFSRNQLFRWLYNYLFRFFFLIRFSMNKKKFENWKLKVESWKLKIVFTLHSSLFTLHFSLFTDEPRSSLVGPSGLEPPIKSLSLRLRSEKRRLRSFIPVLIPLNTLVGPSGLEPPTSCLSGTRSNLLSYEPMWCFFALECENWKLKIESWKLNTTI